MDTSRDSTILDRAVTGYLLGCAVGDALGLPMEGLTKLRQRRMYPDLTHHHFVLSRGMVSDDTEHACMTAEALIISGGDTGQFARSLARQLKAWFLQLPAGIGYATLRSLIRLCVGFPTDRSGVFSAGNGPAMRSPILGVCWGHDLERLRELVRVSTRMTHTDPKAEYGALAVALAAHHASTREVISADEYCCDLHALLGPDGHEIHELALKAAESALAGRSTEEFATEIGCARGVSGYMYHTVPSVLHAWFRYPDDFRSAITGIIACGGDTDTTAAILGGIVGARVGKSGIPQKWMDGLAEWPRTVSWMERLGGRLAESCTDSSAKPYVPLLVPGVWLRNLLFLLIVLLHGFRRVFPPY